MGLNADAVDWHAGLLQPRHQRQQRVALRVADPCIPKQLVEEQFGLRVGLVRKPEGACDVALAKRCVEDVLRRHCSVLAVVTGAEDRERLVDYVPDFDLASVAADNLGDPLGDQLAQPCGRVARGGQLGLQPGRVLEPVPEQGVGAQAQLLRARPSDQPVGRRKIGRCRRFRHFAPLEGVLAGDGVEVGCDIALLGRCDLV